MALAPSSPSNPNNPVKTPVQKPGFFQINAQDPQRQQFVKILVYGAPGSGKTTLGGSAADVEAMRDVLVISAEGGTMVFDENDRIKESKYLDIVRIERMEQLQKLYEFLQAHLIAVRSNNESELKNLQSMVMGMPIEKIGLDFQTRLRKYKTVIIDSLTEIEAQNLTKILGYDENSGFDEGDDVAVAKFDDFRKNNNIVQRIVRSFRDLQMNVVIVCGVGYVQDEMKRFYYSPSLTGKLSQQVQGFMDIVGYLVNSTNAAGTAEIRKMYVQPVAQVKFAAKNRRASYKGVFFEDPTMKSIMSELKLI